MWVMKGNRLTTWTTLQIPIRIGEIIKPNRIEPKSKLIDRIIFGFSLSLFLAFSFVITNLMLINLQVSSFYSRRCSSEPIYYFVWSFDCSCLHYIYLSKYLLFFSPFSFVLNLFIFHFWIFKDLYNFIRFGKASGLHIA